MGRVAGLVSVLSPSGAPKRLFAGLFIFYLFQAQVILQLFSKKLEKMLIENFYYPEYLSDGADILANNLPFVGKPVWFSASVSHRITPKYIATQNDHVIQGE